MATTTSTSVTYKKATGTLTFHPVSGLSFRPSTLAPNAVAPLTIALADITNLQQTPPSSTKTPALRVVVQAAGAAEPTNHVFTFTAPQTGRSEQEAMTAAIREPITALKAGGSAAAPPAKPSAGAADSPTPQDGASPLPTNSTPKKPSSSSSSAPDFLDNAALLANTDLQKSLLAADGALRKRFESLFTTKPSNMSTVQFNRHFWASRLPLLRMHAQQAAQKRAAYNVLSGIAPRSDATTGAAKLSVTAEQVNMIYEMHPVVRRAFVDNVRGDKARMTDVEFWQRFFVSRLFKALQGKRVDVDRDPADAVFDKYLSEAAAKGSATEDNDPGPVDDGDEPRLVKHIIDLAGNEQNTKFHGNAPDMEMRNTQSDKAQMFDKFNELSKRLMRDAFSVDNDAEGTGFHDPKGKLDMDTAEDDDETFQEMKLRDLAAEKEQRSVKLNIRAPKGMGTGAGDHAPRSVHHPGADIDNEGNITARDPAVALRAMQGLDWKFDLSKVFNGQGTFMLPQT